jgi:lipopolysaccharide assembly outer membrane protein LptD (OstA)
MKRAFVLTLVIGSSALLNAQAPQKFEAQDVLHTSGIIRMSGGISLHSPENVVLRAEEAEYNQLTGETALSSPAILRQEIRPASQTNAATNAAGEPFPAPKEVVMRMRGGVQIVIGDMTVRADEADVNGLTGEMVLRGDVRMTRAKK